MKLLIAGDTHGNLHHMRYLSEQAEKFDVSHIVVLGDFGYWEHQSNGIYFLNSLSKLLQKQHQSLFWIDGNHENHSLLRWRYMGIEPPGGVSDRLREQNFFVNRHMGAAQVIINDKGFYKIREQIWYIPRGHTWLWDNVRFAALGGAYSIDINYRTPGESWWAQETIELDEAERLKDVDKVDIFFSHDAPSEVQLTEPFHAAGLNWVKGDPRTEANRAILSKAVEYAKPDYLFHGHYHLPYTQEIFLHDNHKVKVKGLGADEMGNSSWTILFLDELTTKD